MIAFVIDDSCMGFDEDCVDCRLLGGSWVGEEGALTIDSRLVGGGGGDLLSLGVLAVVETIGSPHMLLTGVVPERGVSELPRGRPLPDLAGASRLLLRGLGGVGGRFSPICRFLGSADGGDCTSDVGRRTMDGGGVPERSEAALVTRVGLGESTSVVDLLMTCGVGDLCRGVVGSLGDKSHALWVFFEPLATSIDICEWRCEWDRVSAAISVLFTAVVDFDREMRLTGSVALGDPSAFFACLAFGGVTRGLLAAA